MKKKQAMLVLLFLLAACSSRLAHHYNDDNYALDYLVTEESILNLAKLVTPRYAPATNAENHPQEPQPGAPIYHPFAMALSDFITDLIPAPIFEDFYDYDIQCSYSDAFTNLNPTPAFAGFFGHNMPYSSHAVMVDIDGNGTQGVLASRWVQGQRQHYRFEQYLLWLCGDELRKETLQFSRFGISQTGRLVALDILEACNISVFTYTLLDFVDGELSFIKTLAIQEYWALGWMLGDYTDPDYLHAIRTDYYLHIYTNGNPWRIRYRDWYGHKITCEEFYDILTKYSLYDVTIRVWGLPDETQAILSMLVD